jgi:hypothetical protein
LSFALGALLVAASAGVWGVGQSLAQPQPAEPAPGSGAADRQPLPQITGKPMVLAKSVTTMVAERIAKQVIAASPIADPNDAAARDLAGERLAQCKDLIEACPDKILWGGFNPAQGYDPEAYRLNEDSPIDYFQLTEFNPVVFSKLYLSTFMFSGKYEVRQEGKLTVLALDAQFRGGLDPGDYPYPFWHSPNKWTAYVNTFKVLMIFESGRLVAAMRQAPPPEALKLERRKWDARWTWTDEAGNPQPRVALFSYLFSKDNPHVAELDSSFRALEESFRAQNCLTCHSPDNRGRISDLLLLNYPNQSLVMRRTLVAVLEDNQMPPGSVTAEVPTGIQDRHALDEMIRLAKDFEAKADAALAYEQLHGAAK